MFSWNTYAAFGRVTWTRIYTTSWPILCPVKWCFDHYLWRHLFASKQLALGWYECYVGEHTYATYWLAVQYCDQYLAMSVLAKFTASCKILGYKKNAVETTFRLLLGVKYLWKDSIDCVRRWLWTYWGRNQTEGLI